MELNADFDQRAVVHAAHCEWISSPMVGVDRRMLDRIGEERARATSLVRYAPQSHFSAHVHSGGEEFFVLEGTFQDEHGDFPAGSYVRNPPTSSHTPGSAEGCVIFVKLWQFDLADRTHVRIDTNKMPYLPSLEEAGVELMPLFQDQRESVRLERWRAGTQIDRALPGGIELLVLTGGFEEGSETFGPYSWLRLPKQGQLVATAGGEGATVWVKSGHLAYPQRAPQ